MDELKSVPLESRIALESVRLPVDVTTRRCTRRSKILDLCDRRLRSGRKFRSVWGSCQALGSVESTPFSQKVGVSTRGNEKVDQESGFGLAFIGSVQYSSVSAIESYSKSEGEFGGRGLTVAPNRRL